MCWNRLQPASGGTSSPVVIGDHVEGWKLFSKTDRMVSESPPCLSNPWFNDDDGDDDDGDDGRKCGGLLRRRRWQDSGPGDPGAQNKLSMHLNLQRGRRQAEGPGFSVGLRMSADVGFEAWIQAALLRIGSWVYRNVQG